MHFGFIGLGDLGAAMAEVIGDPLTVFDVNRAAMEPFGARACLAESVAQVGREATLIGLCVRNDDDVRAVVSGPDGLLSTAAPGTVIAVHATVRPTTIIELAELADRRGVSLFDAAVSGGPHVARRRQQSCIVGGSAAVIERARPLLESFSSSIVHAGALGQGMVLKFANNLTTYMEMAAAVESYRLVEAAGIDPALLTKIMTANGNLTETMRLYVDYRTANARELLEGGPFRDVQAAVAGLAEKDLGLAVEAGSRVGVTLLATAALRGVFRGVVL
jgi:3-hydroxyisobutyrate dehydrogenase-like beta-hydroxyacid dehydrogenase